MWPLSKALLGTWQQQVRSAWYCSTRHWLDGVALDGKTLRGAHRLGAARELSAECVLPALSVALGQVAVADTTDELAGGGPLLDQMLVAGETLSFDALFTQTSVAEAVVSRGLVDDGQRQPRQSVAVVR